MKNGDWFSSIQALSTIFNFLGITTNSLITKLLLYHCRIVLHARCLVFRSSTASVKLLLMTYCTYNTYIQYIYYNKHYFHIRLYCFLATGSIISMRLMHKFVVNNLANYWSEIADFLEYPLDLKRSFYHDDPNKAIKALLEDWIISDNGRKPKTWSTFVQVLKETGQSEGQPVADITGWVIYSLQQEGVVEGKYVLNV